MLKHLHPRNLTMPNSMAWHELEADIISACRKHEHLYKSLKDYRRCVAFETYFVKFDSYKSLRPQYETQEYLSRLAAGDQSAPCIPRVYHFFKEAESPMAYMVMEYIEITIAPDPDLPQKGAGALEWLRCVPAPSGVTIGCLGNCRARHALFKNGKAPVLFSSVAALEKYLNTVRPCLLTCS